MVLMFGSAHMKKIAIMQHDDFHAMVLMLKKEIYKEPDRLFALFMMEHKNEINFGQRAFRSRHFLKAMDAYREKKKSMGVGQLRSF